MSKKAFFFWLILMLSLIGYVMYSFYAADKLKAEQLKQKICDYPGCTKKGVEVFGKPINWVSAEYFWLCEDHYREQKGKMLK